MPVPRQGRVKQKARTREALIAATRRLLAREVTPTVEQAAAEADVSRTTAYRYFANQRALLAAAYPETEAESLLGSDPPTDADARLAAAVEGIIEITLRTEPELRAMLRASLEKTPDPLPDLVLRKGRRVTWITDALAPLRGELSTGELRRLVHAIAAAVGIDTLVWYTDVAGCSRDEAVATMRWTATILLRASLADRRASA